METNILPIRFPSLSSIIHPLIKSVDSVRVSIDIFWLPAGCSRHWSAKRATIQLACDLGHLAGSCDAKLNRERLSNLVPVKVPDHDVRPRTCNSQHLHNSHYVSLPSASLKGSPQARTASVMPHQTSLLHRHIGDEDVVAMTPTSDVHSAAIVGTRLPCPLIDKLTWNRHGGCNNV